MTETTEAAEPTTWTVKLEGGPAFPTNAAAACRIAARDRPSLSAVFTRLAAAIDSAQSEKPAS